MEWSISSSDFEAMKSHCVQGFPLEACGLFLGEVDHQANPTGTIKEIWPAYNIAQSSKVYEVDPKDMFEATKHAQKNDLEIVGVFHSHTHSEAYPSPTDMKQAVDPKWCYAILSLASEEIVVRYFSITKDNVTELQSRII